MTAFFRVRALGLLFITALVLLGHSARADNFSSYAAAPSFSFPTNTAAYDALPDGRLIAIVNADIYRETAVGSRTFTDIGTLPNADIASFGAAFLRVSPNGTMIAVGNNGGSGSNNSQVGIFTLAPLAGQWFAANHFDAAWADNRYVVISAGSLTDMTSLVTALDTSSPTPANPVNPTIVNNIVGASAGIAVDSSGNLYTGNGFKYGTQPGSQTGSVYAFRSATWRAVITSGAPLNFETQGIPIVDLLSASPLDFDSQGNLFVAGSPGSNPINFALVHAPAIATALAGGGLIDTSVSTNVRYFDPDPSGSFFTVNVNRVRQEVYGVDFGTTTAYTFKAASPVPAAPEWSLGLLAVALASVGLMRGRRLALSS
jgi:hypothetical protein